MVSLWQVGDFLNNPFQFKRLGLNFEGHGGEIARGFYSSPEMFLFNYKRKDIFNYLKIKFASTRGNLILPQAIDSTADYLRLFVDQTLNSGFSPLDVPDVFYTYQRVGRWAGVNGRKNRGVKNRFNALATKVFVEAAFSLEPARRCGLPLHNHFLKWLNPELHKIPFEKGGWPSEYLMANFIPQVVEKYYHRVSSRFFRMGRKSKTGGAGDIRFSLFQKNCDAIRDICLAKPDSLIWKFVNRPIFEKITSSSNLDNAQRVPITALYDIATVCFYDEN